jgi:mRNA interferase MazF
MHNKDYRKWSEVKANLNVSSDNIYIRAGEIRWVAIGVNVGSEIDGKGVSFTRPCLILHVIGGSLALVIPFTSKNKANKQFYKNILLQHFNSNLCLSQIRVVSQKRIFKRLKKVPAREFIDIKREVFEFYSCDIASKQTRRLKK